jgi:hypothetical protein
MSIVQDDRIVPDWLPPQWGWLAQNVSVLTDRLARLVVDHDRGVDHLHVMVATHGAAGVGGKAGKKTARCGFRRDEVPQDSRWAWTEHAGRAGHAGGLSPLTAQTHLDTFLAQTGGEDGGGLQPFRHP